MGCLAGHIMRRLQPHQTRILCYISHAVQELLRLPSSSSGVIPIVNNIAEAGPLRDKGKSCMAPQKVETPGPWFKSLHSMNQNMQARELCYHVHMQAHELCYHVQLHCSIYIALKTCLPSFAVTSQQSSETSVANLNMAMAACPILQSSTWYMAHSGTPVWLCINLGKAAQAIPQIKGSTSRSYS